MPTVENCTVIPYAGGYKVTANGGYVIYSTNGHFEGYRYMIIAPVSFDYSTLATELIENLPPDAEIFGGGTNTPETVTE